MANFFKFLASIGFCFLAGAIGSFFTSSSIPGWYQNINKPFFNPPNWIFGPVWTVLFLMMGISLYLIWKKETPKKIKRIAISIFAVQLLFNTLWSIAFFGLKSPFLGLIIIIILLFLIAVNIFKFYKISKEAGILLIPYIIWVSFAFILNFAIWKLN